MANERRSAAAETRAEREERVELSDAKEPADADVDDGGGAHAERERDELTEQAPAEAVVEAVPDRERRSARKSCSDHNPPRRRRHLSEVDPPDSTTKQHEKQRRAGDVDERSGERDAP